MDSVNKRGVSHAYGVIERTDAGMVAAAPRPWKPRSTPRVIKSGNGVTRFRVVRRYDSLHAHTIRKTASECECTLEYAADNEYVPTTVKISYTAERDEQTTLYRKYEGCLLCPNVQTYGT